MRIFLIVQLLMFALLIKPANNKLAKIAHSFVEIMYSEIASYCFFLLYCDKVLDSVAANYIKTLLVCCVAQEVEHMQTLGRAFCSSVIFFIRMIPNSQ